MTSEVRQRAGAGQERSAHSHLGLLTRGPGAIAPPRLRYAVTALILLGAAVTVVSGAVHLYLWFQGYSVIAVIGPLFVIQAILAGVTGVVTAVARWLAAVLTAAGVLAGTAIGLVISVTHGIFGFRDTWSAPYARTSLYAEIAGTVVLLLAAWLLARPHDRPHSRFRSLWRMGRPRIRPGK
jgi:hypothetical protein